MNHPETARERLTRLVLAFANSTKGLHKKKVEIVQPKIEKPQELREPKIVKLGINREKGWLYYIDKDGDVARTKMKKGGSKKKTPSKKIEKKEIKELKVRVKKLEKTKVVKKETKKKVSKKKIAPKKQPKKEKQPIVQINIQDNSININKKQELKIKIDKLEQTLKLLANSKDKEKHVMLEAKIKELKEKLI